MPHKQSPAKDRLNHMFVLDEMVDMGDRRQRLIVNEPNGTGSESYQVLLDDYLQATLHKVGTEWRRWPTPRCVLTMDDLDAIVEMIGEVKGKR